MYIYTYIHIYICIHICIILWYLFLFIHDIDGFSVGRPLASIYWLLKRDFRRDTRLLLYRYIYIYSYWNV
jgi:hypothetical protein